MKVFGARAEGLRLERMRASPQWQPWVAESVESADLADAWHRPSAGQLASSTAPACCANSAAFVCFVRSATHVTVLPSRR